MKIADLFESFEYQTSQDVEYHMEDAFDAETQHIYMAGNCGALAVAINKLTGAPIYGLRYKEGRTWQLAHAYVMWGDEALDIRGLNTMDSLYEKYEMMGYEVEEVPLTPGEVLYINYGPSSNYRYLKTKRGSEWRSDLLAAMPIAERLVELAELRDALRDQGR